MNETTNTDKGDTMTTYENRVQALQDEGLTRSDAQGVIDCEDMQTEHPDFAKYRAAHLARVIRNQDTFAVWYDKAAAMVFSGKTKSETVDALSPWGCDITQSNGVQAGALQAQALITS